MSFGERIGRGWFLSNRADTYLNKVRSWLVSVPLLTGTMAYLGLPRRWAVLLGLLTPIVVESGGLLVAWLDYRFGIVHEHMRMNAVTDPFRRESLELQREQLAALARIEADLEAGKKRVDFALDKLLRMSVLSEPKETP